jgi:hypothetical protein
MSHSRGVLHKARFCPWCGLDRLERDTLPAGGSRVEFICTSCGVPFAITPSTRRQRASAMFAAERRQRVNQNGPSDMREDRLFAKACHAKWKEFKRLGKLFTRDSMRAWIGSPEAEALRKELEGQ